MAAKNLTAEAISWSCIPDLRMRVESGTELDLTEIVVPYNVASYLLDDYRIRKGWPVDVPLYDVRQNTLISNTGEVLSFRPAPTQITTLADVRWIPTELTWDDISLKLRPEDGPYPTFVWETNVDYSPTFIDDYSYRVGKELITRNALNFQSDNQEHMWSNFTGGFATTAGFTVIMVMSLESRFGQDGVDLDYAGIFSAGHPTPVVDETGIFNEVVTGGQTSLQMRGRYLWVNSGQMAFQQLFPINLALTRAQPSYLAITVNPPYTKVFMGFGVSTMQVAQVQTGSPEANHLDWVIGRATGDILHCADMTLFDMSLYASPLSDNDLLSEIATLSQSYGG